MDTVNVKMRLQYFLNLLEKEIREYGVSEDVIQLFLAMNKEFCLEGIGGIRDCETIAEYVESFLRNASWGYFDDWIVDEFKSEQAKIQDIFENCLYMNEDLQMYVQQF